jgi:cell division protein ZipA
MELGIRDWMIIIGVLLILAVLLDGFRRMRNERRGNIRMSLNKNFLNSAAPEESTSELPAGGARAIDRESGDLLDHSSEFHDVLLDENPSQKVSDLDLEQSVPILMESVSHNDLTDNELDNSVNPEVECVSEPSADSDRDLTDVDNMSGFTEAADELQPAQPSVPSSREQDVIAINVVAKNDPFKGPDLLHILLACDLRFGDMNIFHRHEQAGGTGAVQFSVANSVEPGVFDLDAIDGFTTTGVCFFMSVPGPNEPIKAFECMVETAQCLVTNLKGEMLDESRSVMTNQTLEHCRQRLQEFERRQLSHA